MHFAVPSQILWHLLKGDRLRKRNVFYLRVTLDFFQIVRKKFCSKHSVPDGSANLQLCRVSAAAARRKACAARLTTRLVFLLMTVTGERNGQVLAAMRNVRLRATANETASSLPGNWRAGSPPKKNGHLERSGIVVMGAFEPLQPRRSSPDRQRA